jgi:hypothetical protein
MDTVDAQWLKRQKKKAFGLHREAQSTLTKFATSKEGKRAIAPFIKPIPKPFRGIAIRKTILGTGKTQRKFASGWLKKAKPFLKHIPGMGMEYVQGNGEQEEMQVKAYENCACVIL